MEESFVVERAHGSYPVEPHWAAGKLTKSFFGLLKLNSPEKAVVTYRCTRCGRLESFARYDACPRPLCDPRQACGRNRCLEGSRRPSYLSGVHEGFAKGT